MNQQPDDANPYVAPSVDVNAVPGATTAGLELATAGTRLKAAMLDGVFIAVPSLIVLAIAMLKVSPDVAAAASEGLPASRAGSMMLLAISLAVLVLWSLGFSIFQWIRIANTGQSLGKKWTGIKIVRRDGSPVTFGSGVGMRIWLVGLLSAIPYAGSLFALVNLLFIFREDRRCLHDHIAGTIVVNAPSTTTNGS